MFAATRFIRKLPCKSTSVMMSKRWATTIPYDPTIVLGNIVHPKKFDVLKSMADLQAEVFVIVYLSFSRSNSFFHEFLLTLTDESPISSFVSFAIFFNDHPMSRYCFFFHKNSMCQKMNIKLFWPSQNCLNVFTFLLEPLSRLSSVDWCKEYNCILITRLEKVEIS